MIEIKPKYVYEVNKLENFYGMIRLDLYITFLCFNYEQEFHKHEFLSLMQLSNFMTECLVQALTREGINFTDEDFSTKDIYISAIPGIPHALKSLLFVFEDRKILISEYINKYTSTTDLKMKNVSQDDLLSLMLSSHQCSLSLIDKVYQKCKKVRLVDEKPETDNKEAVNHNDNFDLSNYETL